MNNTASIFFGANSITQIDYATIDKDGHVVGGSLSPSMIVTGEIDPNEHVVIDFSTCKKDIKSIIDHQEYGIDHKLVVGPWSNVNYIRGESDGTVNIQTPLWGISVPRNVIHFADTTGIEGKNHIDAMIQNLVQSKLSQKYPGVKIDVSTVIEFQPMLQNFATFRYTHGLKSSTSWGCQNIVHGHHSYIAIDAEDAVEATQLAQEIATSLDKMMFVWSENFSYVDRRISYVTPRGEFEIVSVNYDAFSSYVFETPQETTIENLVSVIAEMWEDDLKKIGAYSLYVSEGLSKGAMLKF
jgi:6-pyruvoyl-tetrahydropterin synthase